MLRMAKLHQLVVSIILSGTIFSASNALTDCKQFNDCASCVQYKDCYYCGAASNSTKCGSFTSDIFSIKPPSCPGLQYNWSTCSVNVANILIIICVCAAVLLIACCCCLACCLYCCCCRRCGYLPL
eukprot:Em0004g682a